MAIETRESSFDELSRGLASGNLSRGKALKLMGAALVGGTLASLGIGEAAADDECKPTGKKCRKNAQCCSGNCVNSTCAACPSGSTLLGSTCCPNARVCGSGTSLTCCPEGQECDDEFGACLPPPGPNRVVCTCNELNTSGGPIEPIQITRCSSIDCAVGAQQDLVCVPACASHGGLFQTGCFPGVC
jgi:hypothetical protein